MTVGVSMMTDRSCVTILEDGHPRVKEWATSLGGIIPENHEVRCVGRGQYVEAIRGLEGRRAQRPSELRVQVSGGSPNYAKWEAAAVEIFDRTSVLILDHDLLTTAYRGALTGEDISYLVRCYSDCGAIIIANRFGGRTFDLRLRHPLDSFADVHVGEDHLCNTGLWSTRGDRYLSPWAWPNLAVHHEHRQRRIREVDAMWDRPLDELLKLDFSSLDDHHLDALGLDRGEQLPVVSKCLMPGSGPLAMHRSDRLPEDKRPRFVADRLHHWLEHVVLPGQDILVDAPHLVSRLPALLEWEEHSALVSRAPDATPFGGRLSAHAFQPACWTSRPVWIWASVRSDTTIPGVEGSWLREAAERVFCEDTSRFIPTLRATRVQTTIPSDFSIRYVERLPSVDYRPRTCLLT
jgi:hypothetical protein